MVKMAQSLNKPINLKHKIYDFFLEPLEERYTEQWSRWFQPVFESEGFEYEKIYGEKISSTIKTGAFLDVNMTNIWKSEQIKTIAHMFNDNKIKNGDIFFVPDMWFPIEQLKYMIDLNKLSVKIYTFLHAGSYTNEDFTSSLSHWAKYQEISWALMVDGIFVGSNYHKQSFMNRRIKPLLPTNMHKKISNKIHITGNPFETIDMVREKKNQIIFPNRFDYEKRPNIFLDISVILKSKYPTWEFIVTTSRPTFKSSDKWLEQYAQRLNDLGVIKIYYGLTKSEYYRILSESKYMVSTTIEEMFGYCVIESMSVNTIPIVPNKYSHVELMKGFDKYMYNDIDDLYSKLISLIESEYELVDFSKNIKPYTNAIKEMARIIKRD
jgi:glycosyltransferase involved in cell wall biosynthesis